MKEFDKFISESVQNFNENIMANPNNFKCSYMNTKEFPLYKLIEGTLSNRVISVKLSNVYFIGLTSKVCM